MKRYQRIFCCSCLSLLAAGGGIGCRTRLDWGVVDPQLAWEARVAVEREGREDPYEGMGPPEGYEPEPEWTLGDLILAEFLAVIPGFLVHGLGHFYAGDGKTGRQLSRVGQLGYGFALVGGGVLAGGYFLDQEDELPGLAYSLYGTGGLVGGVGALYLLTAWSYDVIDTPRAVMEGGRPPPRSRFVESLDFFGD